MGRLINRLFANWMDYRRGLREGRASTLNGIFTLYRDYIQASSYVGFALFDSLQVQVLPKIYRNERDVTEKKQVESSRSFSENA